MIAKPDDKSSSMGFIPCTECICFSKYLCNALVSDQYSVSESVSVREKTRDAQIVKFWADTDTNVQQ